MIDIDDKFLLLEVVAHLGYKVGAEEIKLKHFNEIYLLAYDIVDNIKRRVEKDGEYFKGMIYQEIEKELEKQKLI